MEDTGVVAGGWIGHLVAWHVCLRFYERYGRITGHGLMSRCRAVCSSIIAMYMTKPSKPVRYGYEITVKGDQVTISLQEPCW